MNIQINDFDPGSLPKPTTFVEATVRLAQCYKNALEAAVMTDDNKVRKWVDASRTLKSYFKQYQEKDKENLVKDLEESGSKETLLEALAILRAAEPFIQTWAQRFLSLSVSNYEDFEPVHWDMFLDYLVPLSWNWESDLFVLQHEDTQALNKLVERGQERIIVIEPDDKKRKKLRKKCLKMVGTQNVHLVKEKEEITKIIGIWVNNPVQLSRVLTSNTFLDEDKKKEGMSEIEDIVREGMINAVTFDNTIRSHDITWIQNGLGNFHDLLQFPHAKCLNNKFKDYSAIIVSPGPSLEKNIEYLRDVAGNAIIIATSHSLQFLSEKNIIPHVILHVDPNVKIKKYFKDFELEKVDLLILSGTTAPYLYKLPTRRKAWIYANAYFDNWLMKLLSLNDFTLYGSCVSVAALKLAIAWGCSRIALVGQDLSFADGKYYAGNTKALPHVIDTFMTAEQAQTYKIPGYYGEEVLTKNDYRLYHSQFQDVAKDMNERGGVDLFNCTEGGAKIKGFRNYPLADFVTKELNESRNKDKTWSKLDLDKLLKGNVKRPLVKRNLVRAQKHLVECEKLIIAAIKRAKQPEHAKGITLVNLQKKIAKKLKQSMVLKIALQDELEKAFQQENYEFNQKGFLDKGSDMYVACLKVIKKLKVSLGKLEV